MLVGLRETGRREEEEAELAKYFMVELIVN